MINKTPEEIVNDYFAVVGEVARLGAELIQGVGLDYKTLDNAIQKAEETFQHLLEGRTSEALESFKESHLNLKYFYIKVHESTEKRIPSGVWSNAVQGAAFYLERKLPEGYDFTKISDQGLRIANQAFTDELKCLAGVKPSEAVRYVTEQLDKLVDECNKDPAYQHPLKDEPEFRFFGEDPIRKNKFWGQFSDGSYEWLAGYEVGKGSSTDMIVLQFNPRTKTFELNCRQETKDPEEAVRLYRKEAEKIKEGRK